MGVNSKYEVYQNLWTNADGLDVYFPDRFNREWYQDLEREEVIVRKNQNIVSTGAVSLNWAAFNMFTVAVPVNTTFSLINPRVNSDFIIVLVKDATATVRTITWPVSWIWQSAPITSLSTSSEEKAFRVSYLNGKYYITGYADGSGYLPLSGGTVTGDTNFTAGLTHSGVGISKHVLMGSTVTNGNQFYASPIFPTGTFKVTAIIVGVSATGAASLHSFVSNNGGVSNGTLVAINPGFAGAATALYGTVVYSNFDLGYVNVVGNLSAAIGASTSTFAIQDANGGVGGPMNRITFGTSVGTFDAGTIYWYADYK